MTTPSDNPTIRFVFHCCICGEGLHGQGELFPTTTGYKPAHPACYKRVMANQPHQMSFGEIENESPSEEGGQ